MLISLFSFLPVFLLVNEKQALIDPSWLKDRLYKNFRSNLVLMVLFVFSIGFRNWNKKASKFH